MCRFDSNEACQPAVTVSIINPSSYNGGSGNGGGTDFDDDLAIIELGTAWTSLGASAPETMNLSTQSNTELAALTKVHSLGFPSNAPNCTDTSLNRLFHVLEDEPLAAVGGDYVRLKIDGAPGQSGSPFYSCPAGGDEFCASGDPGEIFGVFAGWNSLYSRFVGPKIPGDNRTAILAIAP